MKTRKYIGMMLMLMALVGMTACDSDDNPVISPNVEMQEELLFNENKTFKCDIGSIVYQSRIGYDFDTALDSLRKLKYIPSEIIKEPLEVLFDYDSRLFFGIGFYGECGNYSDVLDTKGNYYLRSWYCSEEDNINIQEENF